MCCFPFLKLHCFPLLSVINQTFIFFFHVKQAPQGVHAAQCLCERCFTGEFSESGTLYNFFLFSINSMVLLLSSEGLKICDKISIIKWQWKAASEIISYSLCLWLLICKVLLIPDFKNLGKNDFKWSKCALDILLWQLGLWYVYFSILSDVENIIVTSLTNA